MKEKFIKSIAEQQGGTKDHPDGNRARPNNDYPARDGEPQSKTETAETEALETKSTRRQK